MSSLSLEGFLTEELATKFQSGELIAIRLPFTLQHRVRGEEDTHLDVYLKKNETLSRASQTVVRGSLTVAKEGALRRRPVHGLMEALDAPISDFFGDAELASHVAFNERSPKLKNNWWDAVPILRRLRKVMPEIYDLLDGGEEHRDRNALSSLLSRVVNTVVGVGEDDVIDPPHPPRDLPASKPSKVVTKPLPTGFLIRQAGTKASPVDCSGKTFSVKVFYDQLLSSVDWSKDDFDLGSVGTADADITVEHHGITDLIFDDNRATFRVTAGEFELKLTGFDERRDLIVSVDEEGGVR